MHNSLLIPKERVAVLIGTRGATRRLLEKKTETRISVDKVSNEVVIEGESLSCMIAENVIRAIGRGFAPHKALELLDDENALFIIDLPKDKKVLKRVRSRLIGTRGKSRRTLEELTHTHISIFGKTVAIIGAYEHAERAQLAIHKLIKGFSHRSVYAFLERG